MVGVLNRCKSCVVLVHDAPIHACDPLGISARSPGSEKLEGRRNAGDASPAVLRGPDQYCSIG